MIEMDIKRSSKKQETREQPGFASREHGGQIKTTIGQKDIIALGRTNRANHQGT